MKTRILLYLAVGFSAMGMVFHNLHGRCCLAAIWLTAHSGVPVPPEVAAQQGAIRESLKR